MFFYNTVVLVACRASAERRLKEAVGYNIYWFCYRTADVDSLPEWLRDHANVRFVAPRFANPETESAQSGSRAQEAQGDVATLPAHQVFGELIRKFDLKTSELISDPLTFFARRLQNSLPNTEEATSRAFIDYSLHGALDRVRQAMTLLEREAAAPLAWLRDAMGRQVYTEAVQAAESVTLSKLANSELVEVLRQDVLSGQGAERQIRVGRACV